MAEEQSSDNASAFEKPKRCLSIRSAARDLGVTERSVYGYIQAGKLPSVRIEGLTMLFEKDVRAFVRKAPGRVRTMAPLWRLPSEQNPMYVTTMIARVLPGCEARFDEMCVTLRESEKHRLPGTAARYIGRRFDDPDEAVIMLIWRDAALPPEDQHEQALQALSADFSAVLDWSMALLTEGQVVLHAG